MERLSVTDHVTGKFQTARNPMNIGGLLLFEVPQDERAGFAERLRAHLAERLPYTPVGRRQIASPEGFDANAWFRASAARTMANVRRVECAAPLSFEALRAAVVARSMEVIDLSRAPFELDIHDSVEGPHCAVFFKVHHTCMDGVGYQMLIELLSDQGGPLPQVEVAEDEPVPDDVTWLDQARARFASRAEADAAQLAAMGAAQAELEAFLADPANGRAIAPEMAFGSEITTERAYRTVALPLGAIKAIGRPQGATVNDVFLALASGALRSYLGERGQLPQTPLVSHSVRSTRRGEDGMTGNRVASIYPELATDETDRAVRLRRIMASMALEKRRSAIEEPLLDPPETPYGTRDREAAFADPAVLHAALGSANVVLSNVPGPAEPLTWAGWRMAGNYPVPIIGPARFLNITSRRNGDELNLGVMVDSAKITDIDALVAALEAEFAAMQAGL